jgi:DNA invertase Pin-like site-specific DNA recombinase
MYQKGRNQIMEKNENTVGTTKYAAIYARTSVDEVDNPRLSIESQISEAIKLAKDKGYEVRDEDIYKDIGRSGSLPPTRWLFRKKPIANNHRPELERLMSTVEARRVEALFIRKRDRLYRSVEHGCKFMFFLQDNNIKVYGTSEYIPSDKSAASTLELQTMMSHAEYFLNTTRENILESKRRQKEKGMKMNGCLTLGYCNGRKKGTVETVDRAIPVVKEVFRRYISGDSRGEIVRWLNQNHLDLLPSRDKKFAAKQWYHSHVARILSNPYYIGLTKNQNNELIPSLAYEKIIDLADWHNAQKLKVIRRNPKHGRKVAEHLLSGMLTCGYCGSHLVAYSRYHRTRKERVGFEFKCPKKHHNGDSPLMMREFLWDEWVNLIYSANLVIPEEKKTPPEIMEKAIQLDMLKNNLEDAKEAVKIGKLKTPLFLELKESLERNINSTKALIDNYHASILRTKDEQLSEDFLNKYKDCIHETTRIQAWDSLSVEQKRIIINSQVESITVYKDGVLVKNRISGEYACFPLLKKHIKGVRSQRPFNALLPNDTRAEKSMLEVEYRGFPCMKINWKSIS